jgi:hypothetical protein
VPTVLEDLAGLLKEIISSTAGSGAAGRLAGLVDEFVDRHKTAAPEPAQPAETPDPTQPA